MLLKSSGYIYVGLRRACTGVHSACVSLRKPVQPNGSYLNAIIMLLHRAVPTRFYLSRLFFHGLFRDDLKCGEVEQMKVLFLLDYQEVRSV